MNQKVVLVNPYTRHRGGILSKKSIIPQWKLPPLGITSLAGYLEAKGYEVSLLDADVNEIKNEEAAKKILDLEPDVVGVTANIGSYGAAKSILNSVKSESRDTLTIMGGPFPSTIPEYILDDSKTDYLIKGEGEIALHQLLQHIKKKGASPRIPGVCFKKGKNYSINNHEIIRDIDSLPMKAWHLLPLKKYRPSPASYKRLPAISTMTSRGCPFKCIYCNKELFGRTVRYHSIQKIRRELTYLNDKGFADINFWDDCFTLRPDKFELFETINEVGVIWNCSTRVDLVDEKTIDSMRKNGCYEIGFGIESGCQKTLNFMRKNTTLAQIRKACGLVEDAGMMLKLYFMFGFPNETKEEMDETLNLAIELNPDVASFTIVTPFPETDLFDYIHARLSDIDLDHLDYWSGSITASNIYDYPFLAKFLRNAFLKFYLRPRFAAKTLYKMRSFQDAKRNILAILSMI